MKLNLPVVLLNGAVLLPEAEMKLEFEDESSKNIIYESEMFHDNKVFIVTKTSKDENILINELPRIGTVARISRKLELPNGKVRISIKGIKRASVIEYLMMSKDSIESIVSTIPKVSIDEEKNTMLVNKLKSELEVYVDKVPTASNSFLSIISSVDDLDLLTDIVANYLSLNFKEKLSYLFEANSLRRFELILEDMYMQEQQLNLDDDIDKKIKKELDNDQKNFYLKEKIKLLKSELGEISPKEEEVEKLKGRVEKLDCPQNIKEKLNYEISRYDGMSNLSPEMSIVRNYIEFLLSLPWNIVTEDVDDIRKIEENLNRTHYGLDEVKSRIIEYLVVKKQAKNIDTPIICLVGPPGVGKTTLGYSIAQSMGRNFVKISVGGVDDEAIIKGHIRTYLGSTYGKIMDGIKRAKSSNPVFLIDEIDKMSSDYKGDPRSALLEVLDANQNKYFKDNYLEEDYDLSKVLFITTANDVNNIPEPLKDRLEIINIDGYTQLEKVDIAKNYLIPNICKKHGIKNIKISDEKLLEIIKFYTKESGLRELERLISKIVRKIITMKELSHKKINLNITSIEKYLGKRLYENDIVNSEIGIANALAYTSFGGDVIQIETNHYEGNGNIVLTGSMGDIMLESSKIALSYIKANYKTFNINPKVLKDDIHINVPNISIRKDGPSAGASITTSILSALSNLKINNNIAFTGEITLRGNILKVGGLKEKIIGAYINNIDTIFIPSANIKDLDMISSEIKNKIKFIPVKNYIEIYNYLSGEQDEKNR